MAEEFKKEVGDSWAYLEIAAKLGSNAAYEEYLKTVLVEYRGMGVLTHEYLNAIDYDYVQESRTNNLRMMNYELGLHNELEINENMAGMCYPFLRAGNKMLREHLLERRVYTPTWWKCVLESDSTNEFEKYLATNLIPLPIDQRYSTEQVADLAKMVKGLL